MILVWLQHLERGRRKNRPSGKELSKIDSVLPCGLRRFEHTNIITLCGYIEGATQHVVAGELRLIVSQLEG